jgi:hypothetical protein
VSTLAALSNAVPQSVWIMAALTLVGITIALVCETLARCSTGLDPEHDPDLAVPEVREVGRG